MSNTHSVPLGINRWLRLQYDNCVVRGELAQDIAGGNARLGAQVANGTGARNR